MQAHTRTHGVLTHTHTHLLASKIAISLADCGGILGKGSLRAGKGGRSVSGGREGREGGVGGQGREEGGSDEGWGGGRELFLEG